MAGIYIHIPFCRHKCSYCDFASFPSKEYKMGEYFESLYKEIDLREKELKGKKFDTVYFGGGTPSYVDCKYIVKTLEKLRSAFIIDKDSEITIEINPATLDKEKFISYEKVGFNRFSVGLQSGNDEELIDLRRCHNVQDFIDTANLLKGKNFSVDLLIGLKNQNKEKLKKSLDVAIGSGCSHISVYALTAEVGTPIYTDYLNGELLDEDETAEMYDYVVNYLKEREFFRYEVSNFCKKGFHSRHNINYWKRGEYLGLGLSAHSFIGDTRIANTKDFEEYVDIVNKGYLPVIYSEKIDEKDSEEEYIMLAFRTAVGVLLQDYKERYKKDFIKEYAKVIAKNFAYLDVSTIGVKIKDEYFFVQNNIIVDFFK